MEAAEESTEVTAEPDAFTFVEQVGMAVEPEEERGVGAYEGVGSERAFAAGGSF